MKNKMKKELWIKPLIMSGQEGFRQTEKTDKRATQSTVFSVFFLTVIVFASVVSASFDVSKNQTFIEDKYLGGEIVKGKVNISFDEQENEMFESNFDGGNKLLTILEEMGYERNSDFNCKPNDCSTNYETIEEGMESFPVSSGSVYGFRISGRDIEVLDMKFEIDANVGASCGNQISIDLFDDKIIDFTNTNYSNEPCNLIAEDYGCFDGEENLEEVELDYSTTKNLYCNRVELEAAPGYEVGAKVGGTGEERIELWLFDANGKIKNCNNNPNDDGLAKCIIGKGRDEDFEGWVCVSKYNADDHYLIKSEEGGDVCGGAGYPEEGLNNGTDYEVYARPLKYSAVGKFVFDKDSYETQNEDEELIELTDDYIEKKYARDCAEIDCVVPFLIKGQIGQSAILENASIRYRDSGNIKSRNKIYRFSGEPFTISSEHLILDIEKMGFEVPNNEEEDEFRLELGGDLVLEEDIEIKEGFDFRIIPEFGLLGRSILFRLKSDANITSSRWNFGDGRVVFESDDNTARHIYTNASTYEIEVNAFAGGKSSTKKFLFSVGNAKTSANISITEYGARLSNLENSIDEFPSWLSTIIKNRIELENVKTDFSNIKSRFSLVSDEDEYEDIAIALSQLEVPKDVVVSETGSLSLLTGIDNIDVNLIGEISGVDVDNPGRIKEGIVTWMDGKYEPEIIFETLVLKKSNYEETLLAHYKIEMKQLEETENVYLIIGYPKSSLDFNGQVEVESISGGVYVEIEGSNPKDVEFVVFGEKVAMDNLGIYLSPKLESLNILENIEIAVKPGFNYGRFFTWLIAILVVMFAVYIIVQTWYKRHYEKHLFKNPNDLYNLINFVYNSRKSGLKEKEIMKKLLERNWSREQVVYAVKKLDGRRTGMWEIPVFKFLENKKVKMELEKKNPGKSIDARFIKMPKLE